MSRENVKLMRAYWEGIARSAEERLDPEATVSRMAEFWDLEIEQDACEATAADLRGVYSGKEAVGRWWREWFDAWETLDADLQLVDAGDRVVTLIDLRMRGRSTGLDVALGKHAWVTSFRDGRMVHHKLYMDQSRALERAGVHENPSEVR